MDDLQLTWFELGAAGTMLAWGLVQWLLIQKRIYAFIAITLGFFVAKLLTHSAVLTNLFGLSTAQNNALLVLFGIGYGINGLYMLHLLLVDSDTRTERQPVYRLAYAVCLLLGFASLFLPSTEVQMVATVVLLILIAILSRDFGLSSQHSPSERHIHGLQWGIYGLVSVSFIVHAAHVLMPSVVALNEPLAHAVFTACWTVTGVLIIGLLTLLDRHIYAQRCADASDAMQLAADENKRRMNQQRFLSMLMHEIRTPLSVVKIGTDALAEDVPDGKRVWANRINVAIDNITQVVENCVQAEKHEEGLIQPDISQFMVELELADIASEYVTAHPELASRIQVAMDAEGRHWLETDKHYLRSIMLNLLSNALKYSPPFTPIYLRIYRTRQKNQHVMRFEIENEIGKAGLPDPHMVFQRYYRAESAKKFAGTGLGLWLSQTMARQIGTLIQMKIPSNNTVMFHFTLPLTRHQ
jgi:signal transduction histidine kinase